VLLLLSSQKNPNGSSFKKIKCATFKNRKLHPFDYSGKKQRNIYELMRGANQQQEKNKK
jgi:hypothetical protein